MTVVGLASYRQMDDRKGISLVSDLRRAAVSGPRGLHGPGPASSRSRAGRVPASRPRPGCCSAGSPRRGTTCSSPTSRATPRSARRSARSCSTRPPARSPTAPRRCSTPPTRPSTSSASSRRHWPAVPWWSPTATSTRPSPTRAPGRAIPDNELERVARWATGDLRPHLTVLLDLPPGDGLTRFESPRPDRAGVAGVPRARPRGVRADGVRQAGALPRRRRHPAAGRDRRT